MPPLSSLIPQTCLTLPTPLSLLSTHWARKHTAASAVGEIHSDALSLLITLPMPPLLLLIPRAHLPLPTPPSLLPIIQACHYNAAASVVVPGYLIPRTRCWFLVLCRRLRRRCQFCGPVSERIITFGLLTSYLFWWQFALATIGRASLPYLVWNDTVENSWGVNWIRI